MVDLIAEFDGAAKRPTAGAFAVAEIALGGDPRPAVVAPATSRITWKVGSLPRRGSLRTAVGVAPSLAGPDRATVRVGISDGRTYETLAEQAVSSHDSATGWLPLAVDLSKYAGPQWRLFYRPDARRWEIVLASQAMDGDPTAVYWAAPGIDTDRRGARRYQETRTRPH